MAAMQASSPAQGDASITADASQKIIDGNPAMLQILQQKMLQLERKVQTRQLSAPTATSKNDMRADSVDTQQPAGKRRRQKYGGCGVMVK
jgi:hypothetical protein